MDKAEARERTVQDYLNSLSMFGVMGEHNVDADQFRTLVENIIDRYEENLAYGDLDE